MKTRFLICLIFPMVAVCFTSPVVGQEKKKQLKEREYHLWQSLNDIKTSHDGQWLSYRLSHTDSNDTLILQHIQTHEKFSFSKPSLGIFLKNKKDFLVKSEENLILFSLNDKKRSIVIPNIMEYKVSENGEFMGVLQAKENLSQNNLSVIHLGKSIFEISDIHSFEFDKTNQFLAFLKREKDRYAIKIINLQQIHLPPEPIYDSNNLIEKLIWNHDDALAFMEKEQESYSVHWIPSFKRKEKIRFSGPQNNEIPFPFKVVNNISTTFRFSPSGDKLFFHIQQIEDSINQNSLVSVWNTKDVLIRPALEDNEAFFRNPPLMVSWNKETGDIHVIGDKESSKAIWGACSPYVYTFNALDDLISKDDPWIEKPIVVYNTSSGTREQVMLRSPYMPIIISPSGKYLSYFKEDHWWVYDPDQNQHINITKSIPTIFRNVEYDYSGVIPPFGQAGWSENEEYLLLYDQYDIWEVNTEGEKFRKLTNGANDKRIFRLFKPNYSSNIFPGYQGEMVDTKEKLLLYTHHPETHNTGIFVLNNEKVKKIIESNFYISNVLYSPECNLIFYTKEHFDHPPAIEVINGTNNEIQLLFQSNPHHFKYSWGKSALIKYQVNGIELQGALFYPSNFRNHQKYPMVTYIYEKMSDKSNRYQNPSLLNGADINITHLTQNGYFVFCPDITYTIDEPGISALNCVTKGVKASLENENINKDKLALFGHSFGGFQTSYIMTKSDLFKCGISGAGYHNLLSFYLSVAWLWQKPQSGRFLNHQQRYSQSYFEIPESYKENSPMEFVQNISKPLLTYTGNLDSNINWQQSVEMFNALRILNKEHIMLIYPDEGHDFIQKKAQIDLTNKIMDWLEHYLKEKPKKRWMMPFH